VRMRVTRNRFERLVRDVTAGVLNSMPAELRARAEQVTVVVADRPTHLQRDLTDGDEELVGLYEGVSLVERHVDNMEAVADRIILFREPLIESSETLAELKAEIRVTLLHELGHYFGFEEDDLEKRWLR